MPKTLRMKEAEPENAVGRYEVRCAEDRTLRRSADQCGEHEQAHFIHQTLSEQDAIQSPAAVYADDFHAMAAAQLLKRSP